MNVLLGITGSIAAYKAIDIAKLCVANGFDVNIVLSKSAHNFVSPLTLKSIFPGKVFSSEDLLDRDSGNMLHISLAKQADVILLAPASANAIATMANGFADCLLSSICLASSAKILVAPAMNKQMWENKFVQQNIERLKQNDVKILGPAYGEQACGDVGYGRMIEPEAIIESLREHMLPKLLLNKKVVITGGATREKIDPVRFISNYSSGKMSYAIAQVAKDAGARVTLISANVSIPEPSGVEFIKVESAQEMFIAAQEAMHEADIFIGVAAVSDYKPRIVSEQKIKKSANPESILHLELEKNVDVIATLKEQFPNALFVGFAAETENLLQSAEAKIKNKKMDMIIANDVSEGKAFGKDSNEVYIILPNQEPIFIPNSSKANIAWQIIDKISSLL